MQKRLKIGLFIDSYFPMIDGVTMVVHNYATRLALVADVVVFCTQLKEPFDDSKFNYTVVRNTMTAPLPLTDYRTPLPKIDIKFMKKLNSYDFDIVHIHSAFGVGKKGVEYAKKRGIPCLFTMHSQHLKDLYERTHILWFSKLVTKSLCKVINKCDYTYAVNQKTAHLWVEYGCKKLPNVLLNATDLYYQESDELVDTLRLKHQFTDEKIFVYCGRIDKTKNIDFTLQVLKNLKNSGMKYKMIFIGGGSYFETFKRHIIENDLENECILIGKLYDRDLLAAYYKLSHLQIFPSTYDTCSLVKLEAASQMTPTIFAKNSFAASTIIADQNGYEEELDVKKFAKKIIDILENEKEYQAVRKNCYNEVYCHWDDRIKEVYQLYQDLIIDYQIKTKKMNK